MTGSSESPVSFSSKTGDSLLGMSLLHTYVLFNNTSLLSAVFDSNFTYLIARVPFASALVLCPNKTDSKNRFGVFPKVIRKQQSHAISTSDTPLCNMANRADEPLETIFGMFRTHSLSPDQADPRFTSVARHSSTDDTGSR
ncbi:MAG: hypothetical protein IID15_00445 [Candidatus Marinimicrobia bacterium]|nr:hypothetical protein [Candidatus Neomarinimicrobiota bacterium]